MIEIAVAGALGRMGSLVLQRVAEDPEACVAAAIVSPRHARIGQSAPIAGRQLTYVEEPDRSFDVLIDVTNPAASLRWLDYCVARRRPIVIGTTGHSPEQQVNIERAASVIPILKASNFSVGVAAVASVVERLARTLGATHDIEIVETHHARKGDAPSGTALTLLDTVLAACGRTRTDHAQFGRHGATGPRPPAQVGIHAIRMGDHPGTHTVYFSTAGETISVTHQATSRQAFVEGAVTAAKWLTRQRPGLYSMMDCLRG